MYQDLSGEHELGRYEKCSGTSWRRIEVEELPPCLLQAPRVILASASAYYLLLKFLA